MQIAILLFDRFTCLDAIGPYQVLSGLPGAEVSFVAERPGPIRDEEGSLVVSAQAGLPDVPGPEVIVVPGGPGQNDQMQDGPVHEWLRAADQTTTWTTSVCTGSLILAAAGLLTGRRATTHWLALDELGQLGATPVTDRVVFDGKYVTAAGVSSGIDMGLALAGRISGDHVAQSIQLMIEYDPQPPYDAGSPDRAPAEITARLRARSRRLSSLHDNSNFALSAWPRVAIAGRSKGQRVPVGGDIRNRAQGSAGVARTVVHTRSLITGVVPAHLDGRREPVNADRTTGGLR